LRDSGQNIDVRGPGRDVLQRMGVEDQVRAAGTGEVGLRFLDDAGRTVGEFPVGAFGSDGPTAELEILRGQLARILLDSAGDQVECVYDERITAVDQDDDGVTVSFASGPSRRFDLLIVSEGIRSTTRNHVFGAEPDYRDLGFYTAYCTIPRTAEDDQWWRWYSTTGGRSVQLRPDNVGSTRACLDFLSPPTDLVSLDRPRQALALRDVYADVDYLAPRVLAALTDDSSSLYVDRIAQVRLPSWSLSRVAVVGDAAYCATPVSGMGTTLALVGAYLLAGELGTHDHHTDAFAAYEERMRPIAAAAQKLPPGVPRIANPSSRLGLGLFRGAIKVAAGPIGRAVAGRLTTTAKETGSLPRYVER
jgi:2-polyprenyl-6-methoxyphenol hydroxylase-like FAD-dependent oxidoreductase